MGRSSTRRKHQIEQIADPGIRDDAAELAGGRGLTRRQ
jgi:hypothetical protein